MNNKSIKISKSAIVRHIVMIVICIIVLIPLLWIVSTSLKAPEEIGSLPPTLLPKGLDFSSYVEMWDAKPFGLYTLNSVIAGVGSSVLALAISIFAAYGLARYRLKGTQFVLNAFLLSQMFPGASILIPVVKILVKLGLYDTRIGLILIYTAFFIPFTVWLLYGYFCSIPKELEEAAFIDGCSRIRSLFRIVLPLALPGLAATFTFCFLGAWNEYLFALIVNNSQPLRTLSVGLGEFIGRWAVSWSVYSASALVFAVPPLILFILMEKALVKGLTTGAVKG